MLKSFVIGAAFFASAGLLPSLAAAATDFTVHDGRLEVTGSHGNSAHHPMPLPPKGQKTIFSNLNRHYPNAAYFPYDSAGIAGSNTIFGVSSVAEQFTPGADADVSQIAAAVGTNFGTADFDLSIYSDDGGA